MWTAQNPDLVKAMQANGRLEGRLVAAVDDAKLVAMHSLNHGLHRSQARELALDSVSLQTTPDEEE